MSKNTDTNPIATVYGEKPKMKKTKKRKIEKKASKKSCEKLNNFKREKRGKK